MATASMVTRRRSSVTNTERDVDDAIDEAFLSLVAEDGCLNAVQMERGLKHLLVLKDPHNDADSICAAIDANEDGHIDPHEFHSYIHPTVVHYVVTGKPLDVQDIMKDAFRATIESDTVKRNKIIQTFMEATHAFEASTRNKGWALPVNKGWMHKLYGHCYDSPTDNQAPRYKHNRDSYLCQRLRELQVTPPDPKSDAHKQKEAYRKDIGCPKECDLVAFCKVWLSHLEAFEAQSKLEAVHLEAVQVKGADKACKAG